MPSTAYIALGANLGNRADNLNIALDHLRAHPQVNVLQVSTYHQTPAFGGPPDSPPFLNAAAQLQTTLSPQALLDLLLTIERFLGRERTIKWSPRTLDLDILLFDDLILDTPTLKIPHPLMHTRDFVLAPLNEIAPEIIHPTQNHSIHSLLKSLRSARFSE